MIEVIQNFCFYVLGPLLLVAAYFGSTKFTYYFKFIASCFIAWSFSFIGFIAALRRPFHLENSRILYPLAKALTWFDGINVTVDGSHNLRGHAPCVVVVNHQSAIDILRYKTIKPGTTKVCFKKKSEIFSANISFSGYVHNVMVLAEIIPLVNYRVIGVSKRSVLWAFPYGTYLWLCNWAFIRKGRLKETLAQLDDAVTKLKKTQGILVIFPEGTRNKSKELLPFKKGAFHIAVKHKINVVPIVLSPFTFIDDNKKIFNSGNVTVKILEPISTEGVEDISEFAESVRQAMTKEYKSMATEINSNNST